MSRLRSISSSKALRVGGFLGAAALTATLVGVGVAGTGAYFTDSEAGSLTGTAGHLNLNVSSTALVLTGLLPGVDQTLPINYNVDVTGKSDVWLTFDPTDLGYLAFTGAKTNSLYPLGGLGRYGHFDVSTTQAGQLFRSSNLAHVPAGATSTPCSVDTNGWGGSDQKATAAVPYPPYCGVPTAIKIASGLTNGQGGTINVTFGLTGVATGLQDQTWASVPFKVVATQEGVRPDALNF